MKCLQSTYITSYDIYYLRQAPKIEQHADFRVAKKHYINQKELAKYISKDRSEYRFVVFFD